MKKIFKLYDFSSGAGGGITKVTYNSEDFTASAGDVNSAIEAISTAMTALGEAATAIDGALAIGESLSGTVKSYQPKINEALADMGKFSTAFTNAAAMYAEEIQKQSTAAAAGGAGGAGGSPSLNGKPSSNFSVAAM